MPHGKCLQTCLPSKENEHRGRAAVPLVCKPGFLVLYRDLLQTVNMIVGEHLHKAVAILCTAARVIYVQRLKAGAVSRSEAGKLEDLGSVCICRQQCVDLE